MDPSSSGVVAEILRPNQEHPAAAFLERLIDLMQINQATDVHLHQKAAIQARVRGNMIPAKNWSGLTDNDGKFLAAGENQKGPVFNYKLVRECLLDGTDGESTVLYRLRSTQVRVEVFRDIHQEKIFLRLQSLTPPNVESAFAANPKALDKIKNAHGLILVCGPAGGGKTTLASGLVQYLAGLGKHIVTLEDPVEYIFQPARGSVTQKNCLMEGEDTNPISAVRPIDKYTKKVLRSDADGLYIGETRTQMAVRTCLRFAAANEQVITTFNASSISDGIAGFIVSASDVVGLDTARLMIGKCLEVVIYVSLAFTKAGLPIPVVTCLPIESTGISLRKFISENSPLLLSAQVQSQLTESLPITGVINRNMAVAQAQKMMATEESIEGALPVEGRFSKPADARFGKPV